MSWTWSGVVSVVTAEGASYPMNTVDKQNGQGYCSIPSWYRTIAAQGTAVVHRSTNCGTCMRKVFENNFHVSRATPTSVQRWVQQDVTVTWHKFQLGINFTQASFFTYCMLVPAAFATDWNPPCAYEENRNYVALDLVDCVCANLGHAAGVKLFSPLPTCQR